MSEIKVNEVAGLSMRDLVKPVEGSGINNKYAQYAGAVPKTDETPIKLREYDQSEDGVLIPKGGKDLLANGMPAEDMSLGVAHTPFPMPMVGDGDDEPTALANTAVAERDIKDYVDERPLVNEGHHPLSTIEVTFEGSFGEISAPFGKVIREGGFIVLEIDKQQPFKFVPKASATGETLVVCWNNGPRYRVGNPGISFNYDKRRRLLVLLEVGLDDDQSIL